MILVATASQELFIRIKQGLLRPELILLAQSYSALAGMLTALNPDIVVVDFDLPALDGRQGLVAMRKINPDARYVLLTQPLSDDEELPLFLAGARGCCNKDMPAMQFGRVFSVVREGQLWIRRSLTPRLLAELEASPDDQEKTRRLQTGRLVELTQREREVAMLVSTGQTNKQIARNLAITERTVKAHLSEIFRKLEINDRLMLALKVLAVGNTDPA